MTEKCLIKKFAKDETINRDMLDSVKIDYKAIIDFKDGYYKGTSKYRIVFRLNVWNGDTQVKKLETNDFLTAQAYLILWTKWVLKMEEEPTKYRDVSMDFRVYYEFLNDIKPYYFWNDGFITNEYDIIAQYNGRSRFTDKMMLNYYWLEK